MEYGNVSFSGLSEDLANKERGKDKHTDTKTDKLMLTKTITGHKLSHTG